MSHNTNNLSLSQINDFEDIIDVRSKSEFQIDHIPNSINLPVLSDNERERIGKIYKQTPFKAKINGASIISKNISKIIQEKFSKKEKKWKPLFYCWRGGQRSQSIVLVLRQIGWDARFLRGGYKSYRKLVITNINNKVKRSNFLIICGNTGTGKTKLLKKLSEEFQVLDLESLANHKGSILGFKANKKQPSQKMFESLINQKLCSFDLSKIILIESESKKIGDLHVPENIIKKMWESDCIYLETKIENRVSLLKKEYNKFIRNPKILKDKLLKLKKIIGQKNTHNLIKLIDERRWTSFTKNILEIHYDPSYQKSIKRNYSKLNEKKTITISNYNEKGFNEVFNNLKNTIYIKEEKIHEK